MRGRLLGLLALAVSTGCPLFAGRAEGPLVAFLGDSLTSGWKLPPEQAYPARVQRALRERGRPIRVLNAGVSGDTVAQGGERLEGVLRQRPDVLVVALGINDGLRGLPLAAVETNLRDIVGRARQEGVRVLLAGMRIPPGRDPEYARRFGEIYERLAADYRLPLVPFLLEGVAGRPEMTFPGGLHPSAAGHERLAMNLRPHLELLLADVRAGRRP
jgi:acyl-CoA thioesterase-1